MCVSLVKNFNHHKKEGKKKKKGKRKKRDYVEMLLAKYQESTSTFESEFW
jgi:hypothetical protein